MRAQLLRVAPADAFQPTPPAPEVVDTASVPANGAATLVPAAPIVAEPTIDQFTPEHAARLPVDVEMLLAAAPLARDTVASSVPPAFPRAFHPGRGRGPVGIDGNSGRNGADYAGARPPPSRVAAGQPIP